MSLKEQLAEYRAGWYKRIPAERQAIMQRHIDQLRGTIGRTMLKVGDRSPAIVFKNATGTTVDVWLSTQEWPGRCPLLLRRLVPLLQPRTESVSNPTVAAPQVIMGGARVPNDYLIIAAGARHSYFGHDEWAPFAPELKQIDDATTLALTLSLSISQRRFLSVGAGAARPIPPAPAAARPVLFSKFARHFFFRQLPSPANVQRQLPLRGRPHGSLLIRSIENAAYRNAAKSYSPRGYPEVPSGH